ncbi:hypothetical protein ABGB14_20785 [Nonomuraea sp. B10E15]|uniref:hypothetical protein n=1 Tax=Nonomuraea sp. B10E15 TaxID=3153560 RepID=UPI00325C46C7
MRSRHLTAALSLGLAVSMLGTAQPAAAASSSSSKESSADLECYLQMWDGRIYAGSLSGIVRIYYTGRSLRSGLVTRIRYSVWNGKWPQRSKNNVKVEDHGAKGGKKTFKNADNGRGNDKWQNLTISDYRRTGGKVKIQFDFDFPGSDPRCSKTCNL